MNNKCVNDQGEEGRKEREEQATGQGLLARGGAEAQEGAGVGPVSLAAQEATPWQLGQGGEDGGGGVGGKEPISQGCR